MSEDIAKKTWIVSGAKQLFSRFGLERTTMDEIAKSIKIGKSSLYYYFKSKEEVFSEVIQHEMAGLMAAITEAVQQETDPHKKLEKFIRTRLKYLNEKGDQYTSIKDGYLKHYAFIENLRKDYSEWEIKTIKKILDDGISKQIFEVSDSFIVTNAIYFALKGLEYPWIFDMQKNKVEENIDVLLEILFKGIDKS